MAGMRGSEALLLAVGMVVFVLTVLYGFPCPSQTVSHHPIFPRECCLKF